MSPTRDDSRTDKVLRWSLAAWGLAAALLVGAVVLARAFGDPWSATALALVASGRVPRECGVQVALIDLLCARGAEPEASSATAWCPHQQNAARKRLPPETLVRACSTSACASGPSGSSRSACVVMNSCSACSIWERNPVASHPVCCSVTRRA